jgi:hypothetical protein
MDLAAALPDLLPLAIEWAQARALEAATSGLALAETRVKIARAVGVVKPELIRILIVSVLPVPTHPGLREAALQTGLLGPDSIGLTLGHSVLVRLGHDTTRTLSHEFRHVYQYETAGSLTAFLPVYLQQIVTHGYDKAPFEIDARSHEIDA